MFNGSKNIVSGTIAFLTESEEEVALQMKKAAAIYAQDETSLQLRMMNMTYEAVKEKGALMVIPSNIADSLSGQALGIASAGFKFQEKAGGTS